MGDCENILGDWGWLLVIARFSKAQISGIFRGSHPYHNLFA